MSIQSEITRLSGNVSDALDEIAAKGVTVPAGSNSDDLAPLIRQIPTGSGSAVTVVDTLDSHGGTIREITAVSLAGDTTSAAVTLQGYTGHDALGNPFTGTYVPSGSANIQSSKSYTVSAGGNQTISPDTGYDAMGEVALTVPTAEAATPSLELYTTAGISAIRATTNQQTGWVTGAQKSGSYTLTRIAGQTITPTTSEQTVINNGDVVHAYNGAVKVGKIPSEYIVPSGTLSITANGTGIDVKAYEKVDVSVPTGGGGKAGQIQSRTARTSSTTYTDMGFSITVAKTGTYNIYWTGYRSSTGGTNGAQIYVNGTASGSAVTTFDTSYSNSQNGVRSNVSLNAGDVVTIRARARSSSYYMYVMNLAIIEV